MIVERIVFQGKYGKGDDLVALFREFAKAAPPSSMGRNPRLLTDRSGAFFTIVFEAEWEKFAEWEKATGRMFSDAKFQSLMERTTPLIESGRRDFYNVEM